MLKPDTLNAPRNLMGGVGSEFGETYSYHIKDVWQITNLSIGPDELWFVYTSRLAFQAITLAPCQREATRADVGLTDINNLTDIY